MKEVLKELGSEEIQFICKECLVTEEQLFAMSEDELYDSVYEVMCNIEIDEVCSADGEEESERCEIASDIVTAFGNALAKEDGVFEEGYADNE